MAFDDTINEVISELQSNIPNYLQVKQLLLSLYNEHTGNNLNLEEVNANEQSEVVRWSNRFLWQQHSIKFKRHTVTVPNFSIDLSQKIDVISQYHCPLCGENNFPVIIIPIRISAISKQAVSKLPKRKAAFERAIRHYLRNMLGKEEIGYKAKKLCIHIVFVLGKSNRDKDLDNMSKALLDALKGTLFDDDINIDHLSLVKFNWDGDEDFVKVNIRESKIGHHDNVLFESMNHKWAVGEFLNLEDFMDKDEE
jgi:Holliday junction resolvase RusA-like endonuclease